MLLKLLIVLISLVSLTSAKSYPGTQKWKHIDLQPLIKSVLGKTPLLSDVSTFATYPDHDSQPVAAINDLPPVSSMRDAVPARCIDLSGLCPKYSNECNHPMVKRFCKRTCKLCPDQLPCGDRQPSEFCLKLKEYDYCEREQMRVYVTNNCKMTCGLCQPKQRAYKWGAPRSDNRCGARYRADCPIEKGLHCCSEYEYCGSTPQHCQCEGCFDFTKKKKEQPQCGVAPLRKYGDKGRVIGGESAKKSYYPWQVALEHYGKFICGGTLISEQHVMTAAHCFNYRDSDPDGYLVIVGEHNRDYSEKTEQFVDVASFTIHKHYRLDHDHHDIAIIHLKHPVAFNNHVMPACLPGKNEELKQGSKCYITGWGSTQLSGDKATLLQEVKVPIVSLSECRKKNAHQGRRVTDKMVCAGYDDGNTFISGCHGDSGGPLSCKSPNGKWSVYGVVSWGSTRCNGLDRFTVFTKVSKYIDWINEQTSSSHEGQPPAPGP